MASVSYCHQTMSTFWRRWIQRRLLQSSRCFQDTIAFFFVFFLFFRSKNRVSLFSSKTTQPMPVYDACTCQRIGLHPVEYLGRNVHAVVWPGGGMRCVGRGVTGGGRGEFQQNSPIFFIFLFPSLFNTSVPMYYIRLIHIIVWQATMQTLSIFRLLLLLSSASLDSKTKPSCELRDENDGHCRNVLKAQHLKVACIVWPENCQS